MRAGSIIWGLALIAAGALLLANNLGLLPANVWRVLSSLWPVLIILLGLQVLARATRSAIFWVLAVILVIATVVFAIYLGWNTSDLPRLILPFA